MVLGIFILLLGFFLLFKVKSHEMKNTTDGGVIRHKSVLSGFGWHMLKALGGILIFTGLLVAIFSYIAGNYWW